MSRNRIISINYEGVPTDGLNLSSLINPSNTSEHFSTTPNSFCPPSSLNSYSKVPLVSYEVESAETCLDLPLPGLIIIAGITESGKTSLCKSLIYHNRHKITEVKAICPTVDLQSAYDFLPPSNVQVTTDEEEICAMLDEQENIIKSGKSRHLVLILDDFIGSDDIKVRSKLFARIAGTSRHYQLTVILLTQHLGSLAPVARENAKAVFITKLKANNLDCAFKLQGKLSSSSRFVEMMNDISSHKYRFVRINADSSFHVFDSPLPKRFILQSFDAIRPKYQLIKKLIDDQHRAKAAKK